MQPARIIARRDLVATALRPATRTFPQQLVLPTIIHPQQSRRAFFHDDHTTPSTSRKTQRSARESWFARRKRERSARKKISTLALDHNSAFEADASREQTESQRQEDGNEADNQSQRRMTRRQRRLLLWTAVLTMPLWGRDIVESVVPGMLGVFILVAGNIKKALKWTWSFSKEYRS